MTLSSPVHHAIRALQVTSAQFLRREGFHHSQCHACLQGRYPTGTTPIFHRHYRVQANRFEHSESMGSNAHLWRLQPGRRRLFHDLLFPLPSPHAQASQIRRLVSVYVLVLSNTPALQPKLCPTLPLVLSTSASLQLACIRPFSNPPPSTSLPHTTHRSLLSPFRALPCIATSSLLPIKSRYLDPGHLRRLAQAMCKFVWPRLTHPIRRRPELCHLHAPHAKPQHPRKMRASSIYLRYTNVFTNTFLFSTS